MSSQGPPLYPSISTGSSRSRKSTGSSSRSAVSSSKSRKRNSTDTASGSANNESGKSTVDQRLRSILSHPLGLPLLFNLYGKDPNKLDHLAKESYFHSNGDNSSLFDDLFATAVKEWQTEPNRDEPQLTKLLTERINKHVTSHDQRNIHFVAGGEAHVSFPQGRKCRIDILLSPVQNNNIETPSTPLLVMEVGRNSDEWWAKLDQNRKYVDMMQDKNQEDERLRFEQPLLLAVLTVQGEGEADDLEVKLGVFLCRPKENERFRMTLLWHARTTNLDEASKDFGRLLRVTSDFGRWRIENKEHEYEYYSSNCCRVGDKVLRSYDNRFRQTDRSPDVYMDESCEQITGKVETIFKLPEDIEKSPSRATVATGDPFWDAPSGDRGLLVIKMPKKNGTHFATKPTDFTLIMNQLQQLHSNGFVHGDIRGFNIVFGPEGGLIDFDYSGKPGKPYPKGYRSILVDGIRRGVVDPKPMQKWHDWFAFGNVVFMIHVISSPLKNDELLRTSAGLSEFWRTISADPKPEDLKELEEFLSDVERAGWTVNMSPSYKEAVEKGKISLVTHFGATGSPPGKK